MQEQDEEDEEDEEDISLTQADRSAMFALPPVSQLAIDLDDLGEGMKQQIQARQGTDTATLELVARLQQEQEDLAQQQQQQQQQREQQEREEEPARPPLRRRRQRCCLL